MYKPFEPMANAKLLFASYKTAFLVTVTSARRVGELHAFQCDPPFIKFHPDKVVLRPSLAFLHNVLSQFHLNQDINLPVFSCF